MIGLVFHATRTWLRWELYLFGWSYRFFGTIRDWYPPKRTVDFEEFGRQFTTYQFGYCTFKIIHPRRKAIQEEV